MRLAARLTGWKIDVKSESKAKEEDEKEQEKGEEVISLDDIEGIFGDIDD